MAEVGRVTALYRYPVKSMGSESLDSIEVGWNGFVGDRRWAFVREGKSQSNFPWLTIREAPGMWSFMPRFDEPDKPETSRTTILAPDGREFDVTDPALAELLEHGARVIRHGRGSFDAMPLSLISTRTMASISALAEVRIDPRRFRPNLVINPVADAEYPEDDWVGSIVGIGSMRMRIDRRDKRCVMVNVDPETSTKNSAVLRAIAQERDACLGVYGTTVQPGLVNVGDPVVIEL